MEGLIFNPDGAPDVKCILKDYTEVRENGYLLKKRKDWQAKIKWLSKNQPSKNRSRLNLSVKK